MKRFFITVFFCVFVFTCFAEAKLTMSEDVEAARKQSKKQNKFLVLYFTESNKSQGGKFFEEEILNTEKFAGYAKENLVLVRIEFSDKNTPVNKKYSSAHKKLAKKFHIKEFPIMVFVTPDESTDIIRNDLGKSESGCPKMTVDSFIGFIDFLKKQFMEEEDPW